MDALPPSADDSGTAPAGDQDAISAIDRRLAQAADPREIVLWAQIRGEIVRQTEEVEDRRAARRRQTEAARAEIAKGFLAVAIGFSLVLYGYGIPGFLCLGAGLYSLAPDYVKDFAPWRQERESDHDKE